MGPAGLELCENRSASNTSIHLLQQSNTLATATRTQKAPKLGCLSKLPLRSKEDCSGSKLLLPGQPASGCSPLHNAQSLASVWGSDFLTLTSTADKDNAMLACSAPTTAPYLFHSLQPCCADTKAFAFVPGHVIPHSMLTRDMVRLGDCSACHTAQQCVCACKDFCPKLHTHTHSAVHLG